MYSYHHRRLRQFRTTLPIVLFPNTDVSVLLPIRLNEVISLPQTQRAQAHGRTHPCSSIQRCCQLSPTASSGTEFRSWLSPRSLHFIRAYLEWQGRQFHGTEPPRCDATNVDPPMPGAAGTMRRWSPSLLHHL
jgi:hypothetical protein